MPPEVYWLAGLGSLFALLLTWLSLHLRRRERLLNDLPTSKVSGVFIGLTELKGSAECARPLQSPLAEQEVVHFSFTVEERWTRIVVETYTDKDGKTQTRTRTETGWSTVESGGECTPFFLRDDTGALLIRPEGAKVEPQCLLSHECGPGDPMYYAKGPQGSVANSDHVRRFRENGIPLGAELFIVGQAREREDVVAPEIAADRHAELFLISTRSEEGVRSGYGVGSWFSLVGALVVITAAAWLLAVRLPTYVEGSPLPARLAALGLLAVLLGWGLCWVWMVYNSVVSLRQRVRQGWAQIDVELKRRHDLIPRLSAILSTQQGHERSLQEGLAALRTQAEATAPGVAGPDFNGVAPLLRAVIEDYPALGAQQGFLALHTELVRTEQRIALAREYYNNIATHYATRLERVPDRWVAALGALRPEPLLVAEGFERAAVKVDFQG
jgi:hypothetical protein